MSDGIGKDNCIMIFYIIFKRSNWTKTCRKSESKERCVSSGQIDVSYDFQNSTKAVRVRLERSYSPNPSPSDFHVFRSIYNFLTSLEIINYIEKFSS